MKKFLSSLILLLIFATPLAASASISIISRPTNNLGLIGYWPMDEGSGTTVGDFSGFGNNGTLTTQNASQWTTGKYKGAVRIDPNDNFGDGTNIDAGDIGSMDGLSAVTVSAWVKADPNVFDSSFPTGQANVLCKSDISGTPGTGGPFELLYQGFASTTQFVVYTNSTVVEADGTSNTLDGRWHFLTGTYDGAAVKVWVDGNFEGSTPVTGSLTSTANTFKIGNCGSFDRNPFGGTIDDVRVYNRAFSTSSIQALYNTGGHFGASSAVLGRGNLANGLVGLWTMDNSAINWKTGQVSDLSGQGNNGHVASMSTTSAPKAGKLGQALSFDGATSYIDVPGMTVNYSAITVSTWVKVRSLPSASRIVANSHTDVDNKGFQLMVLDTTKLPIFNVGNGGSNTTVQGSAAMSLNQWYHLVGVYDGANVMIYVNGVLQGGPTALTGSIAASGVDVGIGRNNAYAGDYTDGTIDDVRIYNRALSAADVKQLYNLGAAKVNSASTALTADTTLTSGLMDLWTFDGKDFQDKVYDRVGGNNGYFETNVRATSSYPVAGKFSQAISFNGTAGSGIALPTVGPPGLSFTYSAWFYWDGSTGGATYGNLLAFGQSSGLWFHYPDARIDYFSGTDHLSNTAISTNTWHHIAVSEDSSANATFYLDGVADGSFGSAPIFSANGIGCDNAGAQAECLIGKLDDVRVYNRDLSASEIKLLYNMGR